MTVVFIYSQYQRNLVYFSHLTRYERKNRINEAFQNGQLFRLNRQMSCEMRNTGIDPIVLDKKNKDVTNSFNIELVKNLRQMNDF